MQGSELFERARCTFYFCFTIVHCGSPWTGVVGADSHRQLEQQLVFYQLDDVEFRTRDDHHVLGIVRRPPGLRLSVRRCQHAVHVSLYLQGDRLCAQLAVHGDGSCGGTLHAGPAVIVQMECQYRADLVDIANRGVQSGARRGFNLPLNLRTNPGEIDIGWNFGFLRRHGGGNHRYLDDPCKPVQAYEFWAHFGVFPVSAGTPARADAPALVLASGSVYRRAALEAMGIQVTVDAAGIDEIPLAGESPADLARRLAIAKAAAVAPRHPGALIIGADQVGECQGRQLSKPGTVAAAEAQLAALSGQTASFHSAVALHDGVASECEVVPTRVRVRELTSDEIRRYVALDEPLDCAGSFKVEARGLTLFAAVIADDPSALVGLPMIALLRMLRTRGINPLQS